MDQTSPLHYSVQLLSWDSDHRETMTGIRFRVFVDEQKVPPDLELDDTDAVAVHALATDATGAPAGTGRLFGEPDHPGRAHIGRMAVLPEHRGRGCGAAILQALISHARESSFHEIILSAQTHAAGFYAHFGFKPVGDVYLDCEIPHQDMLLLVSEPRP